MKNFMLIWLLTAVVSLCAEEPVLRAGFITDTHIGATAESCAHVRKAFEVFRDQKVDLIVHLGDIANVHNPAGYRHYRNIFNDVFAERKPEQIFAYAGHDAIGFKDVDEAYRIVEKEIGATNSIYAKRVLKGYPFLAFRQSAAPAKFEEEIKAAELEFPGKPIFVLNHEPPVNTTYHSITWGSRKLRPVLEKHPRVVQFTGHAHSSVRDERNIWQGKFTSISAGCLQNWAGVLVGTAPGGKVSDGMLLMEIYPEKLVIRRFEYGTGREYRPDKRWIVPLPFDEKTAPYAPARRYAETPAPEFAPGTTLKYEWKDGLSLHYPEALNEVAEYRIDIEKISADGKWVPFARYDQFSGFYLKNPPADWNVVLNPGYFTPGNKYRVSVYPMSYWHKCGKPLTAELIAPEQTVPEKVLEIADPMKELQFLSSRTRKPVPVKDGFYALRDVEAANLVLPDDFWEGEFKKARYRLIVDFHADQSLDVPWVMLVLDPKTNTRMTSRVGTVPGNVGVRRYVVEFNKYLKEMHCELQLRGGGPGKVRFEKVRLERIR